jgi:DNA-binding transcriptional regulator YiaG
MTTAEEVRALRAALKEDTATFAARWLCSRRTVEDWEQGRRRPNALAMKGIRELTARKKSAAARAKTKAAKP